MEVVFQLNEEQKTRATRIADYNRDCLQRATLDEKRLWCGNLLGLLDEYPGFNPHQVFDLIGGRAEYRGDRHPFWEDGSARLLRYILIGDKSWWKSSHDLRQLLVQNAHVVRYQSSHPWLDWYEKVESWIEERASAEEVLVQLERNPTLRISRAAVAKRLGLLDKVEALRFGKAQNADNKLSVTQQQVAWRLAKHWRIADDQAL
jgi:hypothetical protein